ncbi:unnamed protein product [Pseudo-nitzschia multistriata]|uniref:Reverse transcriptase Ty1/copia-type domain-containing protein n=1 Tax=Pseudo-nitzschia multistriata TaxID=183589 RepID=A0A448YW03_9STRA|nr:unnamed protein product [Pseudo-nitzschia multistriata]
MEAGGDKKKDYSGGIAEKQQAKYEGNPSPKETGWTEQRIRPKTTYNSTQKKNAESNSTKKFIGHNRGDLEGIVLTENGSLTQFRELHKRLKTLGGSKYMPKVGTSIELLERFTRLDFMVPEPDASNWTVEGKEVAGIKTSLMRMHDEEVKMSGKLYTAYTNDMEKLYSVVLGQVDEGMEEKLRESPKWERINKEKCPVELLILLRDICYQGNKTQIHPLTNIIRAIRKLVCSRQRLTEGVTYVQATTQAYDVLEAIGGDLLCPVAIKHELETNSAKYGRMTYSQYKNLQEDNALRVMIEKSAKQQLLAVLLIEGSNEDTSVLKQTLENQYTLGMNNYPVTPTAALGMLNQFKGSKKGGTKSAVANKGNKGVHRNHQEGTAFVTTGAIATPEIEAAGEDDESEELGLTSHQLLMRAVECDEDFGDTEEHCFFQWGRTSKAPTDTFRYSNKVQRLFAQQNDTNDRKGTGGVNPNWILLDSESSCNLIANPDLLKNIRKAPKGQVMHIYCNSGVASTNLIGDLPGFGKVWFYKEGIANVLSLALVSDRFRVTMDTDCDNALHVHRPGGGTRRFSRSECNLYYCDLTKTTSGRVLTITSVEGQQSEFSDLDCRRAMKARKLQEIMGFPTTRDLIRMVENKLVTNCGVTRRDIMNAEVIYGKHVSIVKGKTVRQQGKHIREDVSPVPADILDRYGKVMLHVDIMTVNGIQFFHSISRHLRFRTTRAVTNMRQSTLLDCVVSLIGQYRTRGFIVTQISGDNQFECLRDDLLKLSPPVDVHCVAAGQHEPTIERSNRTLKETVRCYVNHLPYKKLPKRCVIELIYAATYWLNCRTTGVHRTKSIREIMTGVCLNAGEDCKFQFMEPILAHVDDTDNTMKARAVDALYLRPTGSITGGFYAFDLNTCKRIHRKSATPTPLTKTIIRQVTQIAEAQKMPRGVSFGDATGNTTILDLDDSPNTDDDDASDGTYSNRDADDASVETTLSAYIDTDVRDDVEAAAQIEVGNDVIEEVDEDGDEAGEEANEGTGHTEPVGEAGEETEGHQDEEQEEEPGNDGEMAEVEAEEDIEPVSSRLRKRVTRSHNKFGEDDGFENTTHTRSFFTAGYVRGIQHLGEREECVMLVANAIANYNNLEATHATKQYGMKEGIRRFGEAGVAAVLKELKQLHDRGVVSALDPKHITREMVAQALPYLMFLKRKRDTSIKGRGCADGRRQREYIRKEDAASPTVSLYALVLSCIIDAIEGRDVATVDIPGAFLQTPMPEGEDVYIRLDGTMAELLCRVDPKMYRKYLVNRNGKKTLFTRAEKAIYGTLRAALLFWEKLYGQLEEWGFELNPYDPCTVNKMINDKQCTIVWHVDDLKISHVDPGVVTAVIQQLNEQFGKESPLTETRGKIHDYVGMTLDYSESGKVKLSMFDYLEEIIQNLPDSLKGTAVTPAADHLFKVNEACPRLDEEQADKFHHYVAKLLFMAKRTRPDIQTAVAFLCTRVSAPDEDDWKKLKRVMSYLSETPYIPLVLGSDGSGNAYWHVDAAFAVHNDMRSHSGGMMTFGTGAAITTCTKQKLNTKSSTEAEVVGVDDNMTFILWARYFLQAQHQHMTDNIADSRDDQPADPALGDRSIIYQDNESAIKLERNGQRSSTKRTKHINIRYFFVTDRIKKGEVSVEYCPTDDIIADYFTKPLQGSKFKKFRNTIQGINDIDCVKYKQEYYAAKQAARTISQ